MCVCVGVVRFSFCLLLLNQINRGLFCTNLREQGRRHRWGGGGGKENGAKKKGENLFSVVFVRGLFFNTMPNLHYYASATCYPFSFDFQSAKPIIYLDRARRRLRRHPTSQDMMSFFVDFFLCSVFLGYRWIGIVSVLLMVLSNRLPTR